MVLQRDSNTTRVWGTAPTASAITITLTGASGKVETPIAAVSDATGNWFVNLPEHKGSTADEYTITLTCHGEAAATAADGAAGHVTMAGVLFGDVFGCHG